MAAVLSYFNEIVYEKYNEKYPKKTIFKKLKVFTNMAANWN